jgi:hypothetical protein
MFSELPKLFDRNFTSGYVLPVALFFAASIVILLQFSGASSTNFLGADPVLGATQFAVAVWVGGLILNILNRLIYQFFEGYRKRINPSFYLDLILGWAAARVQFVWRLYQWLYWHDATKQLGNPLPPDSMTDQKAKSFQQWRYEFLKGLFLRLDEHAKQNQLSYNTELDRIAKVLAREFPDPETTLLPSAFGNVILAFERYPNIMYGIEAIEGWERLLTVVPKEYRTLLDDSKAETDVWVNLWILSLIFILEYGICGAIFKVLPLPYLPFLAGIVAFFSSARAKAAALEWGERVKAAFDAFLPDLAQKLGYTLPQLHTGRKAFWRNFSIAIVYGRTQELKHLRNANVQVDHKTTTISE